MKVDLTHPLLNWAVPSARHRYTRRDTALYALSVGVGHDALDPRQIALVDPWSEHLAAMPSMVLVLGYPGFWLGSAEVQRASGINAEHVLHVQQSFELHEPLAVEADVIGHTRVTGIVDKGANRGSLLYSERVIIDASNGREIATCRQTHYLRGFGGFSSPDFVALPTEEVPARAADLTLDLSTRPEQALLYRLNGDANAIHCDPSAASRAGFPRPILHGMCTIGVLMHAILKALVDYDTARVSSVRMRMTSAVMPGDTLRVETWRNGFFRARALERDTVVIDNGWVLTL